MQRVGIALIIILAGAAAAAWAFRDQLNALEDGDSQRLIYMVLAAILVGGGLTAGARNRVTGKTWLRYAALWGLIFGAVLLAVAIFAPGARS